MKQERALKWLFASAAAAVTVMTLRMQFARVADKLLSYVGSAYENWGTVGWHFFADGWATALSLVTVIYFAYRLSSAPPDPD